MRRWGVKALVVLTVFLCLGTAGYAAQVWWANRIVNQYLERNSRGGTYVSFCCFELDCIDPDDVLELPFCRNKILQEWRNSPWWFKDPEDGRKYVPRACYPLLLRRITGQDLRNDPDVWEAWFKAHPNLVWDEKLKRLVEPTPPASTP